MHTDFVIEFKEMKKRGKPSSTFEESSRSTKYKKIQSITKSYSQEEIKEAFFNNLRAAGHHDILKKIKSIFAESEQAFDENVNEVTSFSEVETIALIEDLKLSKWQYETLRKHLEGKYIYVFKTYKSLSATKKECYPDMKSVSISEKCARINLQDLLNHTCSRILKIEDVLGNLTKSENVRSLVMTSKWGCDGASDQSQYRQKFEDGTISDESIFLVSFVSLTIEMIEPHGQSIIWCNQQPGSTRYCRPINFEFTKETQEKTVTEINLIRNQIMHLLPSSIETDIGNFKVTHDMKLTMIDEKVCQALTSTVSSSSCTVCGASPKEMNTEGILKGKPKTRKQNILITAFQLCMLGSVLWNVFFTLPSD